MGTAKATSPDLYVWLMEMGQQRNQVMQDRVNHQTIREVLGWMNQPAELAGAWPFYLAMTQIRDASGFTQFGIQGFELLLVFGRDLRGGLLILKQVPQMIHGVAFPLVELRRMHARGRSDLADCLVLPEHLQNSWRFQSRCVVFSHSHSVSNATPFLCPIFWVHSNLLRPAQTKHHCQESIAHPMACRKLLPTRCKPCSPVHWIFISATKISPFGTSRPDESKF